MGKVRARTEAELAARRGEILSAAARQLMDGGYEAVTLATISGETSVSRTSMYTYYPTKEAVFVDLMVSEYEALAGELRGAFAKTVGREAFCRSLARLLWSHPVLLKLLSQQLSVWDRRYGDELIARFVEGSEPFVRAVDDVLAAQFPDSDAAARNAFKLQFSLYCNAVYVAAGLPESQRAAMDGLGYFDEVPDPEEVTFQGLMLLSAGLG